MIRIPSLNSLWKQSLGDQGICVAVLDGPVDRSHPCFDGASITHLPTLVSGIADQGPASQHGTHVASVIFGQHSSSIHGVAPSCRGLIVPVFTDGREGGLSPCSQIDLARAITQAVEEGADVINISGGQLVASAESDQLLANAICLCQEKNVLIVAAAGNNGCECLHVPAALESVLAVGAMDAQRTPMDYSNWGAAYQSQGILALGENILGASPGGGTALKSGTSFATPIVSGLVALLLSIQLQRGEKPDAHAIRDAILKSALPCNQQQELDGRRCLVGSLNISGAYALITKREIELVSEQKINKDMIQSSENSDIQQEMFDQINESGQLQPSEAINPSLEPSPFQGSSIEGQAPKVKVSNPASIAMSIKGNPSMIAPDKEANLSVTASGVDGDCSCGGSPPPQLVYALGQIGTDFGTEARRDSFTQAKPPSQTLLQYLDANPWEAQRLIWTLNLDTTPIYAIAPAGPYASFTYERLRSFLADVNIERVSIPGYIAGSIRLLSGQLVPVIIPEVRGMYSWNVDALITAVLEFLVNEKAEELFLSLWGEISEEARNSTRESDTRAQARTQAESEILQDQVKERVREYLERVYYEFRNLGVTPQERALNFSATNAVQPASVIGDAGRKQLGLDSITVEKSPICRFDSDCYDVKLQFFNLENKQSAGRVHRFTVDVSDVIPVTIGEPRSWSIAI